MTKIMTNQVDNEPSENGEQMGYGYSIQLQLRSQTTSLDSRNKIKSKAKAERDDFRDGVFSCEVVISNF